MKNFKTLIKNFLISPVKNLFIDKYYKTINFSKSMSLETALFALTLLLITLYPSFVAIIGFKDQLSIYQDFILNIIFATFLYYITAKLTCNINSFATQLSTINFDEDNSGIFKNLFYSFYDVIIPSFLSFLSFLTLILFWSKDHSSFSIINAFSSLLAFWDNLKILIMFMLMCFCCMIWCFRAILHTANSLNIESALCDSYNEGTNFKKITSYEGTKL